MTSVTKLGRYEIRSKLGAGGMGEVYLAEDTQLDRKVAIKILPAESIADDRAKSRLIREARAAAKLDHSNICSIYEVTEEDSRSFIVMQYVEGETLAARIRRKPLELREAVDIAAQVADALAEAHSVGIIHRDIKPENIMITARGQVKVMDFGLATVIKEKGMLESQADTQSLLTEPGVILGTVPYMSPEQVKAVQLDARSDIFSLGIVIYETISGRRPFDSESVGETLSTILTSEPPPLARYSADVPPELERIVSKALRKEREERYQTAKDLALDLKRLERDNSASAITAALSTPRARYIPRQHLVTGALVVLALAGLGVYLWASQRQSINSIAVLPFVNASGDAETEYLSDGITDSLIDSLSQLPNLKVMSRNSVFRYKGKETDAQAAGQALGAQAVLTGKLLQRGDNLSISVELMDARDNTHLWGAQYNRTLSNILSVQAEMAREISERLRLRLAGAVEQRLAKHYTENTEAYQLYLKGIFYLNKRTREAYRKAIEFFNDAIEKDANYARAYAGLADCYSLGDYPLPAKEKYPLAKQAALKAIELDPTLAEAHAALGRDKLDYDWDQERAEKEFNRAIELNPNSSLAHMRYAQFFTMHGRHDEAIAESKKAIALDPLSPLISWDLSYSYYWARRYDEAIEQGHKTLEIETNYPRSIEIIGQSYEQKGMFDKAIEWYLKKAAVDGSTPHVMELKKALDTSGVNGYYRKSIALEIANAQPNSFTVASLYGRLGETEQALEWLQKALEERSGDLIYMKIAPGFDNMRSDPRFLEIMKRVGLAP